MTFDPSQFMRMELAQNAGIVLDDPAPEPVATTSTPTTCEAHVDRALVREILVLRGAPDRDIDWLASSAPSVEHALAFEPTPWMLRGADDFTDYLAT